MNALKSLLGVRKQTRNEIVLTEGGMTEVKNLMRKCQKKIINKKLIDPEIPLRKYMSYVVKTTRLGFGVFSLQGNMHVTQLSEKKIIM